MDIDSLTAEEAEEALLALQARQQVRMAEERAGKDIDKALETALASKGVSVGAPWMQPVVVTCAYPQRWVVQHAGHWWQATAHAVMTEPAFGNPDWEPNDPDPEEPFEGSPEEAPEGAIEVTD